MTVSRARIILLPLALLFILTPASHSFGQEHLAGSWVGAIEVMGTTLGCMLDFRVQADSLVGTIDIPQQAAFGLPLKAVSDRAGKAHFELPAGPGLAVFEGQIRGDSLSGTFRQGRASGLFHAVRTAKKIDTVAAEPKPPYREEDVQFTNGDVMLAGTLVIPDSGRAFPAVVFITGSGAQNRDEELFGFKPFRVIADHLGRHGIATLRYDDRGVGGSGGSGEQSTTRTFAEDALAAVRFLKSRDDIDRARIGLLGHSEGGVAAGIAAAESRDIAFVVFMAGTAAPGEEVILGQIKALARTGGATPAQVDEALALERQVFSTVRADSGWDTLRVKLRQQAASSLNQLSPQQRNELGNVDSLINERVDFQIKAVRSPWFAFFLDHDPARDIERLQCPVLALFGEKDMQVSIALNENRMREALKAGGNQDYTVTVVPGANHLFQEAKTGMPAEYAALKKAFTPGFLETISGWIVKRMATK